MDRAALPADRCRPPPGQRHRRASRAVGHRRPGEDRPDRRRPQPWADRLPPRLPGQPARPGVLLRGVVRRADRRLDANDLRPGGQRARPSGAGGPVLALLPVQRLHQQARGRLGDGAGRVRGVRRRDRAHPGPHPGRLQPARGRRGRTVGRRELEVVDGTHPVVHPAAGSHANYYDAALFLGRSGQQGFGCDDTRAPGSGLRPAVTLVPSDAAAVGAAFPWLAYTGRWGQREKSFYNGPTGPNTKDRGPLPSPGPTPRASTPRTPSRPAGCSAPRRPARSAGS